MTLSPAGSSLGWTPRRRIAVVGAVAVAWAATEAGLGGGVVNPGGWSSFARFWSAVTDPELGAEFIRLTLDAAIVTMSFALLGTALAIGIGAIGALATSELLSGGGARWQLAKAFAVGPRAVHEILWALLLIQVFGFDPLVAVFAIGIPFGAVTAKVFAETIDEADPRMYRTLRASGAGKLPALFYGVLPNVAGELISFVFYRLECAIRSAAVLGVIGAGGLGFQLDLSFETLRYGEIWTLIAALMILSGLADGWSSAVRRAKGGRTAQTSGIGAALLLVVAWIAADIDITNLWSARSRRLAGELAIDLLPPRLGPGGWGELLGASRDTVAMSILALAIAGVGGLVAGVTVARPSQATARPSRRGALSRAIGRLFLLLCRAVPAPIWAFLFVLVLFPGAWPGAVGLGVYNLGVLGRLYAETIEDRDTHPTDALVLSGASPIQAFLYASLPVAAPRLVSLTLYRWEVIARETVVVGVVGAGGLGQLINEHVAARDLAAVAGAIAALIAVSLAIDSVSSAVRRRLR